MNNSGRVAYLVFFAFILIVCPVIRAEIDDNEDFEVNSEFDESNIKYTSRNDIVDVPEGFSIGEDETLSRVEYDFKTEVNRLMSILVNSLYSNVEVFLRELISNASDALEKFRFLALTDKSQLDSGEELCIRIYADRENKILHIRDYGIGMDENELRNSLGNIANSGTADFLARLGDAKVGELSSQIGQFGVGFYSSFLAAHKVRVTTKANGSKQYIWEANDSNFQGYTISEDPRGDTLGRGTLISLYLKSETEEFLDQLRLESYVRKYSEFIDFPIYIYKEVDLPDEKLNATKGEGILPTKASQWVLINKEKPIWTRSPSEITKEEYKSFFNHLNNDNDEPLETIHFKAEGDHSFTALLFVPENYDISNPNMLENLKFYVKRVFITSNFEGILPRYLRFLIGVVDSDDFELNVSRETFQNSKMVKSIIKKITKKVLRRFMDIRKEEPERWERIYSSYSKALKLGAIEDYSSSVTLSRLVRFYSYRSPEKEIELQEYVDNMKEDQGSRIYYLGGESVQALRSSPLLETLTAKGYDVLFLVEPIDMYLVNNLMTFESTNKTRYNFRDVGKEGIKIKEDENFLKEKEKEFAPLVRFIRENPPGNLYNVRITTRLRNTPCALVAASSGTSANLERIEKSQYYRPEVRNMFPSMRVFELNPRHPIIVELLRMVIDGQNDTARSYSQMLYDSSLVASGFIIDDPLEFSKRMYYSVADSLGVSPDVNPEEFSDAPLVVEDDLTPGYGIDPSVEREFNSQRQDHKEAFSRNYETSDSTPEDVFEGHEDETSDTTPEDVFEGHEDSTEIPSESHNDFSEEFDDSDEL